MISQRNRARGPFVLAANLRKIYGFLKQVPAEAGGVVHRLRRRRTTRAIGEWLPEGFQPAALDGPGPGPDPPPAA